MRSRPKSNGSLVFHRTGTSGGAPLDTSIRLSRYGHIRPMEYEVEGFNPFSPRFLVVWLVALAFWAGLTYLVTL
jgi:hypothetical protein